jgi:hypothetical protein
METIELRNLITAYLANMSEKELKAYHIAKDHLGDSFQLEKSIGFLEWVKKRHVLQVPDPAVSSVKTF